MTTAQRTDRNLVLVVAVSLGAYLLLLPHWIERLSPLTGDEPFYVMTALSIVRDRDLNEINNYDVRIELTASGTRVLYGFDEEVAAPDPLPAGWTGWPAAPRYVGPHAATTDRDGYYTKHGLGLSLLIAVPFELAGRVGANLVVALLAALLAGQMYLLSRDTGLGIRQAQLLALAFAVAMPLGPYALLLFPEIPAAFMLIYAVRRIAASTNSEWQYLLAGLCIGALPWLHQRFAVTSAVLGVMLLVTLVTRRDFRAAVLGLTPIAVLGSTLIAYNVWLYGGPVQPAADHAGFHGPRETANAVAGLLLDAQWGLLVAAPVSLIALAALPHWLRRQPTSAAITIAAIFPYLATVASYSVWWGEWGPAARYLVPIFPFAVAPLAAWLATGQRTSVVVTSILWAIGMALTIIGYVTPKRFYHHPDGINNLYSRIDEFAGTALSDLLVPFQPYVQAPAAERFWISIAAFLAFLLAVILINRSCLCHIASGDTTPPQKPHNVSRETGRTSR